MTVTDLCGILSAKEVNIENENREITCGYAGDLLSFVMGRAPTGCAWFTVMTNVNVCAVATLADVGCVVICEGSQPMPGFKEKATEQGINVILTDDDIYTAIKKAVNAGKL